MRKEALPCVTEPDVHDDTEVAAMLRELGIALLEVYDGGIPAAP